MKKLLIALLAVSSVAHGGSFSMDDYKAKTGGEIKKVEAKKNVSIAQKILNTETKMAKLQLRLEKLGRTEQATMDGYAKQIADLADLEGDTARAAKSIARRRKSKVTVYARERASIKKEIAGCEKLISYWEKKAELVKIERSLRIAGILKSSVSA